MGVAMNLDFLNGWGAKQEGSLNANAVRSDTANGEVLLVAAISQANDGSAHKLDTFSLAFNDAKMNGYIITRPYLG
jgi:hypothetical protein